MPDVDTRQATVTIYRAKNRFNYGGRVIERGGQFTPQGAPNDRQIMEHLCYVEQVPLSDLLPGENSVESSEGVDNKQSRGRKKATAS